MADRQFIVPENSEGIFFVDSECIACDICSGIAPESFRLTENEEYAYVFAQPVNDRLLKKAYAALESCPVDAIGSVL